MAPTIWLQVTRAPDWFFDKQNTGYPHHIGPTQFEQFLLPRRSQKMPGHSALGDGHRNPIILTPKISARPPHIRQLGFCYCAVLGLFNPADTAPGATDVPSRYSVPRAIPRFANRMISPASPMSRRHLVNYEGEKRIPCSGKIWFSFYASLYPLTCSSALKTLCDQPTASKPPNSP